VFEIFAIFPLMKRKNFIQKDRRSYAGFSKLEIFVKFVTDRIVGGTTCFRTRFFAFAKPIDLKFFPIIYELIKKKIDNDNAWGTDWGFG